MSPGQHMQDFGRANKVQVFKKILVVKDLNHLCSKDTEVKRMCFSLFHGICWRHQVKIIENDSSNLSSDHRQSKRYLFIFNYFIQQNFPDVCLRWSSALGSQVTIGGWVNFRLWNLWKRIGKTPWVRIEFLHFLTNPVKHFSLNCFNVIFCRRIYIFARLFQHEQRIRVLRDFEKSTHFAWSRLELYAVLVLSGNRRIQFSSGVFNNQWNQSHFVELRLSSRKSWILDVCSLVARLWLKPIPGQWIQKITNWNH